MCEVSRDGSEDPGDLPSEVIEQMIDLGLQKEIAPLRLKQGLQDQIDSMERSHARKIFRAENPIPRGDPEFWQYIMKNQFDKYDRSRSRATQELLRTIRRLCESEDDGSDMAESFPGLEGKMAIQTCDIRLINSSVAIAENAESMPCSTVLLSDIAQMDDEDILESVKAGHIHPHMGEL